METSKYKQYPIDAVILWVDGNDDAHKQKMSLFLEDKNRMKDVKFRTRYDQVDEIKFTVDSILKFASFIRKIYIITDNQIPDFLKKKENSIYGNVKIIDHKVIFKGYEEFLPTFNNRSIETCMYRIPGLAEYFIYFNDDFFLINETSPEDFYQNKSPVLRGTWEYYHDDLFFKKIKKKQGGHKIAQQYGAKILGFHKYYRFKHTPHPLRKSTFQNYFDKNPNVFINNIKHKFRNVKQFTPQGFANHLEIEKGTTVLKRDLNLVYFRSYKKPLLFYKYKFKKKTKKKLFLGLQSLDRCPNIILVYILEWLNNRTKI